MPAGGALRNDFVVRRLEDLGALGDKPLRRELEAVGGIRRGPERPSSFKTRRRSPSTTRAPFFHSRLDETLEAG